MPEQVFKLAVIKLGCIGAAPLLDLIVDERADREDLAVRAFTSGAKLDPDSCQGPLADALAYQPGLVLAVSPNAALPGPAQTRQRLTDAGIPVIIIADGPSRRAFYKKDDTGKQVLNVPAGQGFIILPCDPMLGARREFLDPSEMVLFNAEIIKLLAATGVIRCIQNELDRVIAQLRNGHSPDLPTLTVVPEIALEAARFANPYAAAKAYAALKIAEAVAAVTTTACFVEQDAGRYVPMVAAAHEMVRTAARLADEAREIEKYNDSVVRTPHSATGQTGSKIRLGEKLT
jgi:methylenetetrahydromethanopterin dehydrogenase